MDDGSPSLEVGFAIEAGGSFDILEQVQRAMDTTEARVVRDAASIEQATGGMVNIGDAVAQITSFGNAASRELQQVAKEAARVEKSGEALVRQLERQNAAYGLTREELRGVRVEEQALAAERVGNTDLAQRLRDTEAALRAKEFAAARAARIEAENAAEDKQREADIAERAAARKAQALMQETAAAAKLAREHAELAALVRGSAAAQEADAVAAERLRMSTDPLYAATKRLNDEIAESTRLYHAGMTAPEEYARQQAVLQQRLKQTTAAHDMMQGALVKNGRSLTQFSFQLNDIATMAALGAPPLQILASQGGQIIQIFQMAEGGAGAFARQLGALAIAGAPVAAVIAVAGVAIWRFKEGINDDAQLKKYAEGLGLTRDEMKKLGDVSVTTGDLLKGLWTTIQVG
ncbi:MAG: hypothetical protein E6Q40_04465 [Cupriavidus sp.]|nr:MAG: hypothetical protein E6Q40_04465 [Cupriavidus sp.]